MNRNGVIALGALVVVVLIWMVLDFSRHDAPNSSHLYWEYAFRGCLWWLFKILLVGVGVGLLATRVGALRPYDLWSNIVFATIGAGIGRWVHQLFGFEIWAFNPALLLPPSAGAPLRPSINPLLSFYVGPINWIASILGAVLLLWIVRRFWAGRSASSEAAPSKT